MSDFRVAVRRTNEWDGPSMLKIYTPYVEKTHYTPDTEVPTLAEYVQRIDTYTYGRMWILTEINNQTAGFCFLTDRFSRSSTSPESPCGAQRNISTS